MKLLLIYRFAPHYRSAIFQLMDRVLGCDFVFGEKSSNIRTMDYATLTHKVSIVRNVFFGHCYVQKGVSGLIRADYDTYLVLGDIRCLSIWLFLFRSLFHPRKRVYLWGHGWLGKEGVVKRMLGRLFYGMCDGVFIYNERSRQLMIKGGIPERKLTTIYNSLDYDAQLAIRESLLSSDIYRNHFGNGNPTIVFIGRLTAVKRLDMLLDAVSVLSEKGAYCNIVFVGDGVMRLELEEKVRQKGMERQVWFYGACYDEKTNAELIYNADLCVSPGNIGLTAMHVLMFGCPAVTNDDFNHQMPEFEAIKEGQTGTFFKDGDVQSLADSIAGWFARHAEEREAVRQACYKEIDEKWNPHHQIRILKSVLEK
ncbi:MAG: glycosyltransferase family 4 protein [Bacteroidales bacterium]|nr:glycosyltransferase family 4 protein [Bacteroidales bacterium]